MLYQSNYSKVIALLRPTDFFPKTETNKQKSLSFFRRLIYFISLILFWHILGFTSHQNPLISNKAHPIYFDFSKMPPPFNILVLSNAGVTGFKQFSPSSSKTFIKRFLTE
jgi:hypothetical protein